MSASDTLSRRPPQSNSCQTLSRHCRVTQLVEIQYCKGGIQQHAAATGVTMLSPHLSTVHTASIPVSLSKALVFRPGAGNQHLHWYFTFHLVALSRQRSNHTPFVRGRNLPDKEFRYLRTVIVGGRRLLGLKLVASFLTSPLNSQHRAGVSPYTPHLSVSHRPVFLLNSWRAYSLLRLVSQAPLLRSYGVILPGSNNAFLPPALDSLLILCRFTVRVYMNNSGFSWQPAHLLRYFSSLRITSSDCRADLPARLYPVCQFSAFQLRLSFASPTVLSYDSTGISTCCPSATSF